MFSHLPSSLGRPKAKAGILLCHATPHRQKGVSAFMQGTGCLRESIVFLSWVKLALVHRKFPFVLVARGCRYRAGSTPGTSPSLSVHELLKYGAGW